mgnify:FL=1
MLCLLYGCSEEGPTISNEGGTTNQAPNAPKNPHPSDSAHIDTTSVVILTWYCTDPDAGDTLKYDIYISNTNPPSGTPAASNLVNPSYGLGIVPAGHTYYWKVVAKDQKGASTTSSIWRFYTNR